jgi:hypothetical protein
MPQRQLLTRGEEKRKVAFFRELKIKDQEDVGLLEWVFKGRIWEYCLL